MLEAPSVVDTGSTELALEDPNDDFSRILDIAGKFCMKLLVLKFSSNIKCIINIKSCFVCETEVLEQEPGMLPTLEKMNTKRMKMVTKLMLNVVK